MREEFQVCKPYHGSNSWMMLSNLMTAKSLEENPASHARANTVKTIKLFAPEGFNNLEELDIAWAGGPTVLAAITLYRHWEELPRTGG